MAALLHIDALRQHTLPRFSFPNLLATVMTVLLTLRLRRVAWWRIGPNGRPVQRWTAGGVATRVPSD